MSDHTKDAEALLRDLRGLGTHDYRGNATACIAAALRRAEARGLRDFYTFIQLDAEEAGGDAIDMNNLLSKLRKHADRLEKEAGE